MERDTAQPRRKLWERNPVPIPQISMPARVSARRHQPMNRPRGISSARLPVDAASRRAYSHSLRTRSAPATPGRARMAVAGVVRPIGEFTQAPTRTLTRPSTLNSRCPNSRVRESAATPRRGTHQQKRALSRRGLCVRPQEFAVYRRSRRRGAVDPVGTPQTVQVGEPTAPLLEVVQLTLHRV